MSTEKIPQEASLLTEFEIRNIPDKYREYYAAKRNNFYGNILAFPALWKGYTMLDRIWLREFEDLTSPRDPRRMFPIILYSNGHAKIRIGLELAFSGCMAEARSILRDAIECVAHAHKMLGDPNLQKVWLNKNDGEKALEAFKDAFERNKRGGLFKGLDELHRIWGELSETGSHTTLNSLFERFEFIESAQGVSFRLNYTTGDYCTTPKSLFILVLTCSEMEKMLFEDFADRLKLDERLMQMRAECDRYKERLRKKIITTFDIKPPEPVSHILKP